MTTPRQFRNAIYQHLTEANVDNNKAVAIAEEAELYVEAYEAFQLRGIEGAVEALKDLVVRAATDGNKMTNQSELDEILENWFMQSKEQLTRRIVDYITANYTPNSEVERLVSEAYKRGYIASSINALK